MSKRQYSEAKREVFDPSLVYLDKETNLHKVPTTWTRSGFRIINEEEKRIYKESVQKRKDEKVSPKYGNSTAIADLLLKEGKERKDVNLLNDQYYNEHIDIKKATNDKLAKKGITETNKYFHPIQGSRKNTFISSNEK
jgi:uncharacterized membrane protein